MSLYPMRAALPLLLAGLSAFTANAQTSLLVGPTSLEFVVAEGASQPLPQSVAVVSDGPALSFQTHAILTSTSANWLSVSQVWGTTPASLSVSVDASGLRAGVYNGYISITSGQSTSAMLAVTLKVGVPAAAVRSSYNPSTETLRAFPKGLTFTAHTGAGVPAPQSLVVPRSDREDGLTANSSAAWLSVSPAKLDSTGRFQEMQVSANPDGLAAGQYSASVLLRSASGVERTVPVTFNVGDDAHLVAEPSVLAIRAQANRQTPSLYTISIGSSNNKTLNYTAATESGSWLAVGPQSGSTGGSNTISVALNPANLAIGTHTGSITVTAPGAMEPLVIPVSLTVTAQTTGLSVTPTTVTLPGGTLNGPAQTATASLTSSLSSETFSITTSIAAWLSITPLMGTASTTPTTLTISGNPNLANLGQNSAQVSITGGSGEDILLQVFFTVTQGSAPSISSNPASLTFSYTEGGTAPSPQTIALTSSPSTSFSVDASGTSFVTVSPTSGTTPATLTVTADSSLGAGTYREALPSLEAPIPWQTS